MSDIGTIQEAVRERMGEIERALAPLRVEFEQLTRVADVLSANGGRSRAARRPERPKASGEKRRSAPGRGPAPAGAARGRPRGSGHRTQQALALIAEQPGITVAEIAKTLGISPNYLYRVIPPLEKDGKVTKQGKGYHPGGSPSPSAE